LIPLQIHLPITKRNRNRVEYLWSHRPSRLSSFVSLRESSRWESEEKVNSREMYKTRRKITLPVDTNLDTGDSQQLRRKSENKKKKGFPNFISPAERKTLLLPLLPNSTNSWVCPSLNSFASTVYIAHPKTTFEKSLTGHENLTRSIIVGTRYGIGERETWNRVQYKEPPGCSR
jgi:hypothetical protein